MEPTTYIGLLLLLIIVLGIAGNGLSMLVWLKGRRCRNLPCAVFLRALAVSDTFALCIPALNEAVGLITGKYPHHHYNFICKVEVVWRHFGLLVSSWIIVSFTLERTISIYRPTAQQFWHNNRNSIMLVSSIFAISFFMNLPYGIVNEIHSGTIDEGHLDIANDTDITLVNNTLAGHNVFSNPEFANISRRFETNMIGTSARMNDTFPSQGNRSYVAVNTQIENGTTQIPERTQIDNGTTQYPERTQIDNGTTQYPERTQIDNGTTQDPKRTHTERDTSWIKCESDPSSLFNVLNWYHIWLMDFVLIFVVPFTLIAVCNAFVISFIIKASKNITSGKKAGRALAVTKRAVVVSVMHCVTTGPFSIFVLIPEVSEKALMVKYSPEYYGLVAILLFAYLNHGVNYIIYSAFGTDFRRDCAELLRSKRAINRSNSSVNRSSSSVMIKSNSVDMTLSTITECNGAP